MGQNTGILVRVTIVILLETGRSGHNVEGWVVAAPWLLVCFLNPLEVLGDHGVHDAQEGFVTGKQAVPASQGVSFTEAFALVFGQLRIDDAARTSQLLIGMLVDGFEPLPLGCVKEAVQPVTHRFIRTKDAEVLRIELNQLCQVVGPDNHVLLEQLTVLAVVERKLTVVWQYQRLRVNPTVGNWVAGHALVRCWYQRLEFRHKLTIGSKLLLWVVGLQPVSQVVHMRHVGLLNWNWNLVCPEATFNWQVVPGLGTRPALWRAHNEHRPVRHGRVASRAGVLLNRLNGLDCLVHCGGELRVQLLRVIALNKSWCPASTLKVLSYVFVTLTRQNRWVRNFETIHVNNWEYGTVMNWVDEGIAEPTSREWASFGFPIPNHGRRNHVGVIQNRTDRVAQ